MQGWFAVEGADEGRYGEHTGSRERVRGVMRGLHEHSEAVKLYLFLVRFSERTFESLSRFCTPKEKL